MLAERMRDADAWVAPSGYFSELMGARLKWSAEELAAKFRVIPNGIALDGFKAGAGGTPTIGYLARFVPGKGLGLLVDAFLLLKKGGRAPGLRLRCGGSMTADDARYVAALKTKIAAAGYAYDVDWLPNLSRGEKLAFLESVSVFSVPATYSEAFGLYVIEAMAAGLPVVAPAASAFPEILAATGGGVTFPLGENAVANARSLADALANLLVDLDAARTMGAAGRAAVLCDYSMSRLAERLLALTSSFSPRAESR
jgi:glycosyltransferase involved in cell wall biosynthesis